MLSQIAIERELYEAVALERERRIIDETKKKAVVSTASYDEFKARVACATLIPLKREDWNTKAATIPNKGLQFGRGNTFGGSITSTNPGIPRTAAAFERDWKRLPRDAAIRLKYLHTCVEAYTTSAASVNTGTKATGTNVAAFSALFRDELDCLLFESVMEVLASAIPSDSNTFSVPDTTIATCILRAMGSSRELNVVLAMQSLEEKNRMRRIIAAIQPPLSTSLQATLLSTNTK